MEEEFPVFIAGLLIGALIMGVCIRGATTTDWRTEAVERDLALYCPDDGKWAWKGECEND